MKRLTRLWNDWSVNRRRTRNNHWDQTKHHARHPSTRHAPVLWLHGVIVTIPADNERTWPDLVSLVDVLLNSHSRERSGQSTATFAFIWRWSGINPFFVLQLREVCTLHDLAYLGLDFAILPDGLHDCVVCCHVAVRLEYCLCMGIVNRSSRADPKLVNDQVLVRIQQRKAIEVGLLYIGKSWVLSTAPCCWQNDFNKGGSDLMLINGKGSELKLLWRNVDPE